MHYKCRNNQSLQREKVIRTVASSVTDDGAYPHVVNLKNPELVVCVEIIKVWYSHAMRYGWCLQFVCIYSMQSCEILHL